jgi:ABC-type multidrug transport system fused ATPase/permease subunit
MQFYIYFSSGRIEPQFKKRQELFGSATGCSQDFLNSAIEIKAMNLEKPIVKRYSERIADYIAHVIKLDKAGAGTDTLLEGLGFLQNILLLALGGFMVFAAKISIGDLLIAQLLSGHINAAVKGLNFFRLRMNLVSAFRIFELWDENDAPTGACIQKSEADALTLSHVSFAYPQRPEAAVLKDITISVKRNQKAALAGPNGSGKSSIVKLIAGFYPPDEGAIFSFQTGDPAYSMIEQDTFIFEDTFFNNIACGNICFLKSGTDVSDLKELAVNSAKRAGIHDYIMSTEHGYDSVCAANGGNMSGGQRQRLAIARCLCRNADIVLLDEPTSALDHETEAEIMKNLNGAFFGKTVIMITHNINPVKDFDVIYLVNNGQIAGYGTHEELLENELYSGLLKEANNG